MRLYSPTQSWSVDAEIERLGVLGGSPRRDLQDVVELAALSCGVPTATINLITTTEQHQIATAGFDPSSCQRAESMCAVVLDEETVVVADARQDPRFAENPYVVAGQVRFYASAPLRSVSGMAVGRLCVFDDRPHELAEHQRRLLPVLASRVVDLLELRRSNELLSRFAGQISHDLRSPLTAVLANADLLAEYPQVSDDEEVYALVTSLIRAAERMNAMVERILAYARLDASLHVVDVDLGRLMDGVLADLGPQLHERDAVVSVGQLPTVRGDREQLYAVLLNLVANAVKFVPYGVTPRVEVVAARDEGSWRVAVSDNGPGIPVERRTAVFELFARIHDGGVEGSGIGLATVRRAIEAHGGQVGIDETPDGGSSVWFTIPAGRVPRSGPEVRSDR